MADSLECEQRIRGEGKMRRIACIHCFVSVGLKYMTAGAYTTAL